MKIENFLKVFSCLAVGCLLTPSLVGAGQLEVTSESSLGYYERDTSAEKGLTVIPFYEYLSVDYDTDVEGLSFHGYGWGMLSLGDRYYFPEETGGEFMYGYLEYTLAESNTNLKLGRQHMFSGVANESLDGLSIRTDLGANFDVSLYGGSPVAMEPEDGRGGDFIVGGRVSNYISGLYELGLSYKRIRNDSIDDDEMFGVDVSLNLPHSIGFNGFSTLNMMTDSWAEHSYELQIQAADFQIRPFLQRFQYDDYFSTNKNSANPFRLLATTGEELTIIGTEVDWFGAESYEVNLKAKNIEYDLRRGSSKYWSGMVIRHLEDLGQVGIEFGEMFGDTSDTDYLLGRAFVYWTGLPESIPVEFISGDLVFVHYQENIYGQSNSTFISLGAGETFLDEALEVKVSLDYSKDPYFDSDIRSMLVVEYTFGKEKE
jgi:hypothetical protein